MHIQMMSPSLTSDHHNIKQIAPAAVIKDKESKAIIIYGD